MEKEDRTVIGEDVKLIQFRWPLGMPLVRKIEADLWELRSHLSNGRIARVFFTVHHDQVALLHGFIKKSQKTPTNELEIARSRRDTWLSEW
jgi:phage-related protein